LRLGVQGQGPTQWLHRAFAARLALEGEGGLDCFVASRLAVTEGARSEERRHREERSDVAIYRLRSNCGMDCL
jgi:hypothetical protein